MAELEKVIKCLEHCRKITNSCEGCPYENVPADENCMLTMHGDALELLKELIDERHCYEEWKEGYGKNQPQIVRCKDCKYYHKPEYGFTYGDCTYCSAWRQVSTDDFCSKGRRKDT